MKLWKYNRITGYWTYVRDDADGAWLPIFEKAEPNTTFKRSKNKPKDVLK